MAVRFGTPSKFVTAGRERRGIAAAERAVRIEWFIKNVSDRISLTMKQRVGMATEFVKSRVVHNISRSVRKGKGPRGGTVVTGRSKAGEFPRADTKQLMRTVFSGVLQPRKGVWDGFIGTPLDYGVILEIRMDRSFLVRTLNEEMQNVKRLLSGPIK